MKELILYPAQRESVDKFKTLDTDYTNRESFIVASDTGTGKTIVICTAVKELKKKLFVICPKSLVSGWMVTMNQMNVDGLAVNPEMLRSSVVQDINFIGNMGQVTLNANKSWTVPDDVIVVWDEYHKHCTGMKSHSGLMLATLKRDCKRLVLCSATPPIDPVKLRYIGYAMGLFESWNQAFFERWMLAHKVSKIPVSFSKHRWQTSAKAQEAFVESMSSMIPPWKITRVKREDIPCFPKSLVKTVKVFFDQDEGLVDWNSIHAAYDLTTPAATRMALRQVIDESKINQVADIVTKHIAHGKSVIVFTCFKQVSDRLHELLSEHCESRLFHGDVLPSKRARIVEEFNSSDKPMCVVATQQSGGVGLSFHTTDPSHPKRVAVIFPGDSVPDLVQTLGRVQRLGGYDSEQYIICLEDSPEVDICELAVSMTTNSVIDLDKSIVSKLTGKRELLDRMLDGCLNQTQP